MKSSLLFLLLFFITVTLSAQEKNNYHTASLSFGINGFVLNNYYGGVGGRYWISESTVLNTSIGFSLSQKEYDKTENIDKQLEKYKYFNLGIGMENHFSPVDDFSPYFSSRLSFSLNDRYYRLIYSGGEQSEKTYSINLEFGLGVEYWVHERISFSGQHMFQASYETGERNTLTIPNEKQNTNGFNFNLGTTSLIISIYF